MERRHGRLPARHDETAVGVAHVSHVSVTCEHDVMCRHDGTGKHDVTCKHDVLYNAAESASSRSVRHDARWPSRLAEGQRGVTRAGRVG